MNLRKLFERKRPHVKATLDGQSGSYIVPIDDIQSVVDEAIFVRVENEDHLKVEIVMMRPSDVAELPEFNGF